MEISIVRKTTTQELIDLIKTKMMETLFVPSTRLSCDYKGDTLYSVKIIRKNETL